MLPRAACAVQGGERGLNIRVKAPSVIIRPGDQSVSFGVQTVPKPSDIPYYEGDYEVIPEVVSQTLETRNKIMRDDVTVREIPYYEVSNESGLTVYIAESLDD